MTFRQYIAIDWSGAKGPRLPGLQAAACKAGRAPPAIVPSPGNNWTRTKLLDWLVHQCQTAGPVLIGFDFAFAYPYCDARPRAYFPGHAASPASAAALWAAVDGICQGADDFYGGPFYRQRHAPFADYLCHRRPTGERYDSSRYRVTETVCRQVYGVRPTCVFKCVGAESVGCGSVAGMRVLHHLVRRHRDRVSIWPFHRVGLQSVILEIFPRLYYVQADEDPRRWRDPSVVNRVLTRYDSDSLPRHVRATTEDQADALVSAAAIRCLARQDRFWNPSAMTPCARRREGWIFGV
jgi:hypothetical protein